MASKRFEKGSEEWQMFTDFWKLCQKYWEPEQTDEYWECAVKEFDSFYKKYRTPYAKHLAVGMLNALEETEKGKRKNDGFREQEKTRKRT